MGKRFDRELHWSTFRRNVLSWLKG